MHISHVYPSHPDRHPSSLVPPHNTQHTHPTKPKGDGFPSGEGYGAIWVLFLNKDGGVKKWRRLDELDQVKYIVCF